MLEVVVDVVEDRDGKISGIPEGSADREAGWRRGVNAGRRGEGVEPPEIDRAVGLEFIDRFESNGNTYELDQDYGTIVATKNQA